MTAAFGRKAVISLCPLTATAVQLLTKDHELLAPGLCQLRVGAPLAANFVLPYKHYDPTAYDNSGQTYDTAAQHYGAGGQLYKAGGQDYNEAVPQDAAPQDGWIDPAQIQPGPPQIDVAALLAAHNELSKKLNHMNLEYNDTVNNTVQQQMKAYQESVDDDVKALRAQRNAAQAQAEATARHMSETIARLERERTQQPRVEPTTPKATKATPAKPTKATNTIAPPKTTHATPSKAPATSSQKRRASGQPKPPQAQPLNPSRSKASAAPLPQQPRSSPTPPRASAKKSSSSASSTNGARGSAKATAPDSTSSSTGKTERKPAEHQMFKEDISAEARSMKTSLQTHIHFIGNNLMSGRAPVSAKPEDVKHFNRRFDGMTVSDLKRQGELGIIKPSEVKLGISVEDAIRSRNKIVREFCQLEESALLHMKSYFAKLGISTWVIDYTQSAYSMYNMVMCMAAINTFRYMVTGSFYHLLRPNTSFIHDSGLLVRVYDHFTHRYQFDLWKKEIRKPGGNELAAERNKYSKTHIRTFDAQDSYLKDTKIRKGLRLMFHPKATSDTESDKTPNGRPVALAREERSEAADQLIRKVDSLIVQDLRDDVKESSANAHERRLVLPFGQRSPAQFKAILKGMPIQYYSPSWWNNRPAHARAKLAPKLIVALPPGITDYFSRRGDNKLSVEELTTKYGAEVFAQYDLDFDEAEGDEADDEGEGDGDEDEGEGDDVGSEDSDKESGSSNAGSVADFLDDAAEQDDDMGDYSDADAEGEENDEDAEAEAANMAQSAEAMDDDI
ncbi:hypothetical protein DFH09DRAFT_1325097 [Mycena vulgaris]|nr:hypothetical protein DFH09DRAFT_1325097 [Mycena vulgaris]